MLEVICISFALIFGMLCRYIKMPPLVGFLCAGFCINILSNYVNIPESTHSTLQHLAHLGVLMLLFTVGLKLKIKQVFKAEVVGGCLLQFVGAAIPLILVIRYGFDLNWEKSLLLAVALSFSSTVFAAKILETKKELSAFHGRTSIGILIIQDLIALAVLALWSGQTPNIFALALLGMPIYRKLLHKLIDSIGHGEMMVLASMMISLVFGGACFTAMGLSSELGALAMGAMLANHRRSLEIYNSLDSLKSVFLVCFFLGVGTSGLPDLESLVFALVMSLLLPVKAALFYFILMGFKLRARTAVLSAATLMTYSEFGLIVAAAVLPEYLVEIAITLAFSYVISAPLNRYAHDLFEKYEKPLRKFQRNAIHPDEQPTKLDNADILIFGMGRTGSAAYKFFENEGYNPIGLDADTYTAERHRNSGRNVHFADAEDIQFWKGVNLKKIKATILAMDDIEAKLIAARRLKIQNFKGPIISHALHKDHQDRIRNAGATHTYLTMTQAGIGLAETTLFALKENAEKSPKEKNAS